jgi:hypothetical protein
MWGTSSPDDKLTGDLGNVIETTQIGGRRSNRLTAEICHRTILDFCNTIPLKVDIKRGGSHVRLALIVLTG